VLYHHFFYHFLEPHARSFHVNRFELEVYREKHFSGLHNGFHLLVVHIATKVFVEDPHNALGTLFYFGIRVGENVLVEVEASFKVFELRFFRDNFGVCVFVDLNRVFSIVELRYIDAVLLCDGSGFLQFQKFLNILPFEDDVFASNSGVAY
jgi:hypothetical protein